MSADEFPFGDLPDEDPTAMPPRNRRRGGEVVRPQRFMDAEKRQQLQDAWEKAQQQIEAINAPELTSSARIEKLLALNTTVIFGLLKEALSETPDLDRSVVHARALTAVKDTVAILKSKHEMESVDSFNPRSAKFGIVFGWFCELVYKVLSQHADETTTSNFFNDLVSELSGWEDRIERQFKGVAGKALGSLQSPFVEDMRDKLAESEARLVRQNALEEQIARAEAKLAGLEQQISVIEGGEGLPGSI